MPVSFLDIKNPELSHKVTHAAVYPTDFETWSERQPSCQTPILGCQATRLHPSSHLVTAKLPMEAPGHLIT